MSQTAQPSALGPLGATVASTYRWFVTAHSTRRQIVAGSLVEWPASLVHAKRMGSVVTACGLPAGSWTKFFHLQFPAPRTTTCGECLSVVRRPPVEVGTPEASAS